MNFQFWKSPWQRAIERGLSEGNLGDKLNELDDLEIKSRADAEAVCWGLRQLAKGCGDKLAENTYQLTALFQRVDLDSPAVEIMREQGTPELIKLFDLIREVSTDWDKDNNLLFILKILALYRTTTGALKIIEATQQPLKPKGYMWSTILSIFKKDHPETEFVFDSLRAPIPPDFIGVALLDAANALLIEGGSTSHVFDSAEGKKRLREWLTNDDPDEFSYAHSATASLPFISSPEREDLLKIAMQHSSNSVRMEAFWVAARLGKPEGFDSLVECCLDFRYSNKAQEYLAELNRKDLIPVKADEPGFAAKAKFSRWLEHPNELGRAPDEMEILDHRTLNWPPDMQPRPFWLIKFKAKDVTGLDEDTEECGLVGSITVSFFSYKLAQRPPEDAFAVHCYWEMTHPKKLIEETDIEDAQGEYNSLLNQWRGGVLEEPKMLCVTEVSPQLKYPQRLVGLASARLGGSEGWVVLDGDRSEWYPKSDMPADVDDSVVLKIHIGRYLLGFKDRPDRKKYLVPSPQLKPDAEYVAAYLNVLSNALKQTGKSRKRSFGTLGLLFRHFEKFIATAIRSGNTIQAVQTIQIIADNWNHVRGYLVLGKASFDCKDYESAEQFLLKFQEQCEHAHQCEEMALLAEIWCNLGKIEKAKALLIGNLQKCIAEMKSTEALSKEKSDGFEIQRNAFLRLFPSDGEESLKKNGV